MPVGVIEKIWFFVVCSWLFKLCQGPEFSSLADLCGVLLDKDWANAKKKVSNVFWFWSKKHQFRRFTQMCGEKYGHSRQHMQFDLKASKQQVIPVNDERPTCQNNSTQDHL